MKDVILYTDGACSGNPGPGGWGAILFYYDNKAVEHKLEISGGEKDTTNNRMELTAVIEGIKKLTKPCHITVYSDSQYVCNAFNKGWLYGWIKKNWINSSKEPVKNVDLWKLYLNVSHGHEIEFINVKGHSDNINNNRCDELARAAIEQFR